MTMTSGSTSSPGPEARASATELVRAAREFLVEHRSDYPSAVRGFRWPRPEHFNFGLDWFDVIAGEHPSRPALKIVEENGDVGSWTYA
jgi:acetyl-CoA synthetase